MIVMFCDKYVGLVVVQRQLPWRISIQSANDIDDDGAGDDDCGDNDDDHEIVEKYKVITKKWNEVASPAPPRPAQTMLWNIWYHHLKWREMLYLTFAWCYGSKKTLWI